MGGQAISNSDLNLVSNNIRVASWQIQQNDCAPSEDWSACQLSPKEGLGLYLPIERTTKTEQTGRMPRLIWVFAGRTSTLLVLSWGSSLYGVNHSFWQIQLLFLVISFQIFVKLKQWFMTSPIMSASVYYFPCCILSFCAPSKDSDQPGLSCSTTKPTNWPVLPAKTQTSLGIPVWSVFAVHMKKPWVLSYSTYWAHSEDWPEWADAQVDLILHWVHWSVCWFCQAAAPVVIASSLYWYLGAKCNYFWLESSNNNC